MRSPIKRLSLFFLLLFFAVCVNFIPTTPIFAQGNLLSGQEGIDDIQAVFGEPEDIRVTTAKIINITLSFLAIIFLILIVVAGFKYMTASGNEEKVKDSTRQIKQAVIGLVIILIAWSITRFVLIRLLAAASGTNYLFWD